MYIILLNLTTIHGKDYCYPHFIGEETELHN